MKVLLIRLDHIGDIVVSVPPIIRALRDRMPECQIDLLTTSAGTSLLRSHPDIHQIHTFDPPWSVPPPGKRRTPPWLAAKRLAGLFLRRRAFGSYDAIVYLSFSPRDRQFTRHLSQKRVGFAGPYQDTAHLHSNQWLTDPIAFDTSKHILTNCYHLVDALASGGSQPLETSLTLESSALQQGLRIIQSLPDTDGPLIAIHPGHPDSFKTWPFDRFRTLAEKMADSTTGRVVILQSPSEVKTVCERFGPFEHPRIHHLGTDSFLAFASIVAHTDLCIANDGGPVHISSALGVPTLAIFGPTDDRIYRPLGPNTRVIRPESGGRCATPWHTPEHCCTDKECLKAISVQQLADAAHRLLEARQNLSPKP